MRVLGTLVANAGAQRTDSEEDLGQLVNCIQ
jgi:hypothetical protein